MRSDNGFNVTRTITIRSNNDSFELVSEVVGGGRKGIRLFGGGWLVLGVLFRAQSFASVKI